MNLSTENVQELIVKSLTDQLAESEAAELEKWKLSNRENLQEYNDFVYIWAQAGSMVMPSDIDNSKALDSIYQKTVRHSAGRRWLNYAVQAAAVLALSVLFSGVYSYLTQEKTGSVFSSGFSQPIYQEIKAAFGTQAKVELADGTTVFLNSGSKLRFPQSFDQQEFRKVILDGEGFFKVTKNKDQPFVVQTSKLDVKVLGTTFNVDAYADNSSVMVALVEGSVKLLDNSKAEHKDLMSLSPNQVATLNVTNNTIEKINVLDMHKYTAWINGRIVFFGDPIQTVVKKLEKWYNVDIIISDKSLEGYKFTGTFINESLEQILNILSLTSPMTYDVQPIQKQADNSMSKRKIILKYKS